jgi:hypothetical protein
MQEVQFRNGKFEDLLTKLAELDARKVNTVVKATDLRVTDSGLIEVSEEIPGSTDTLMNVFEPNDVFIGHVADTLKIGLPFARRMFAERPDVASDMVNGLWHGRREPKLGPLDVDMYRFEPDARNFLFRGYSEADGPAVARALLSDKYLPIDNYDVVTAVLNSIYESDARGQITVASADLTDRKMFVRFLAPQVAVSAAALLDGYRSPFESRAVDRVSTSAAGLEEVAKQAARWGGDGATLWAGFELSNSEVGDGRFTITPRAQFRVCMNGLKITSDLVGQVHLGGKLEVGAVNWSQQTQRRQLDLIQSMTQDAVTAFLSADYWNEQIDKLAGKAGKTVSDDGGQTVERVGKKLGFTDAERQTIFHHFLLGGQHTAAGVMNAVTSAAQTVPNADRAAELEALAIRALELV